MVLQLQFAFLQATQLQFILMAILDQRLDDNIQVTMLNFKFDNATMYLFDRTHNYMVALRRVDNENPIESF